MRKTSVYLSDDDTARLRQLAEREGRSQAEIIRAALLSYGAETAPDPIEAMPSELLGDSYVITQRNEKGMFVPDSPYYQVTVRPVRPISSHIKGSRATIHFQLAPRTVLQHIVRYVQLTFKPLR